MVLTPSTMLPLGTKAPEINLPDVVSGDTVRLADLEGNAGLLVMFICRHCPYVKHVEQALSTLGSDYADQRLGIVAISSNDASNYPEDAPDSLKEMAISLGYTFPLCYDADQLVAKAYTAACTPDFFLFDGDQKLVYRGQMDDSRPGNGKPVTGEDLRAAIDAVLAGDQPDGIQQPSIGCNIKWKAGNAPAYFG